MIAIIPAAGRGTRMNNLTQEIPKPMLPLWGKPIIGHILTQLGHSSIRQAIIVVGYKSEMITSYAGDGSQFGLEIKYAFQEKLLGTAHAVSVAKSLLLPHPFFLIQMADIIVPAFWYQNLFAVIRDPQWQGALAVEKGDYSQGAAVVIEQNRRVKSIVEKAAGGSIPTEWSNAGIAVLSSQILDHLPCTHSGNAEKHFAEIIDAWLAFGARVKAVKILKRLWIDIKNDEAYQRLIAQKPPSFIS